MPSVWIAPSSITTTVPPTVQSDSPGATVTIIPLSSSLTVTCGGQTMPVFSTDLSCGGGEPRGVNDCGRWHNFPEGGSEQLSSRPVLSLNAALSPAAVSKGRDGAGEINGGACRDGMGEVHRELMDSRGGGYMFFLVFPDRRAIKNELVFFQTDTG
ncbi:hypothetical protein [Methanogenium cariaci]|uniref:hypothetical protein n=1 Tax=Methanogenium cariaci TaxID=2197 RepID=UPI000782BDB4|nr:hypothetical protein [Methanogenium cariaci]